MEGPDQENLDEIEKLMVQDDKEEGETMQVCPVCGRTAQRYILHACL